MSEPTPLRTILVGARGRGAAYVERVADDPRFTPVALVGRFPDRLADARTRTGVPEAATFTSVAAAVAAVEADVALVCTPTAHHPDDVAAATAAGLDVLVEKAVAPTWEGSCAVVAAAEAAGARLLVAQNFRFAPDVLTLGALLDAGEVGPVGHVDLVHHKYRPAPRSQDYRFGMVWDQTCHQVDQLQMLMGPVDEVVAASFAAPWSQYAHPAGITSLWRFASGATCSYTLTNDARMHELRWIVTTERGALVRRPEGWTWLAAAAPDDAPFGWNDAPVTLPDVDAPPTSEQGVLDTLHRAVTRGDATPLDGRANLETLRTCEMLCRAATEHRPVRRAEVVDS